MWPVFPEPRRRPSEPVLVGIESEESLSELAELAKTAGAETVLSILQKRSKPDTAYCVGRGKAEELSLRCQAVQADLVIFDEELSGVMQKNLEELLRVKVVDRTALILDIFAARANTREGKLQVEMAQLQYRSQRLLGQGLVLSRLAGGIGTRGPGESKLEVNRRRIRDRLTGPAPGAGADRAAAQPAQAKPGEEQRAHCGARWIHKRGKINFVQPFDRLRRLCNGSAFCHVGQCEPSHHFTAWRKGLAGGYGRLYPQAAARAG